MMCVIMQNTAMPRPSAVLYMASAIPFDSMRCLSDWLRPGAAMDPKVKEFLRYVLSQEGQADVMRDGKYLPLTADVVREQLKKLD